jgi:hypothetical protein
VDMGRPRRIGRRASTRRRTRRRRRRPAACSDEIIGEARELALDHGFGCGLNLREAGTTAKLTRGLGSWFG